MVIVDNNPGCHEPDDSPQVPVSSFADPALSLVLARLVGRRVKSGCCDQLLVVLIHLNLSAHLDEEVQCRILSDPLYGAQDFHIVFHSLV